MPRTSTTFAALLVAAGVLFGCASANPESAARHASAGKRPDVRAAAVGLLFADANATYGPRAYDPRVLRKRMIRYVARRKVPERVRMMSSAIRQVGGKRYVQPWIESITVGEWADVQRDGSRAKVTFVGYDVIAPARARGVAQPLTHYEVQVAWEDGRWKLVDYSTQWLGPEGPMGQPGDEAIVNYPLNLTFVNPRR